MIEILNLYVNSKGLFKMMLCDTAVGRAEYAAAVPVKNQGFIG